MKNTLIAILVIIILVLGFLFVKGKNKPVVDNSWPETVPATPTDNNSQTNSNNNTNPCAPSIVVSAPATGASYTVGQQVAIKWTTCNVQKVLIGLASGGKNYGHITQNPISASTGSYQWTATNPGKSFTDLNTNSYQIVVESEDGNVMAKSGTFSVTTPESSTDLENAITPLFVKSVYQKNGKWWADVDYVTELNAREYLEYIIQNDKCILPGMTKSQTLNYSKTISITDQYQGTGSVYYQDSLFTQTDGCYLDMAGISLGFPETVNQNSLIRSLPFGANFKTINYCPPEKNLSPAEIKNNITNSPYSYSLYGTKGYFVKKATIKDSTVTIFDYVNGCAS